MAEENPQAAKSAEDRKAASALASLDADESSGAHTVDSDAAKKAMKSLGSGSASAAAAAAAPKPAKAVKVDPADVALLVDQLDLSKPKATELLKAHEADAVKTMRAFVKA